MRLRRDKLSVAFWSAVLQWSRVGINGVVFVLLARWLSLEEIGTAAAALSCVVVVQPLFATVVPDLAVQEKDRSETSLSTAFWGSVAVGVAVSAILLLAAPLLAGFLDRPELVGMVRVLGLCPLVWGIGAVAEGLLRSSMKTRALAIRTGTASTIAGAVALFLGSTGHGAWALVFFTLVNAVVATTLTLLSARWVPHPTIDRRRLRGQAEVFVLLGSRYALSAITMPVIQFLLQASSGAAVGGAFYTAYRLYTIVDSLLLLPMKFLVLPGLVRVAADPARFRERLLAALSIGMVMAAPAYLGVAAVAPDLLVLLFGEVNGAASVLSLQMLCLYGPAGLFVGILNQALVARGLSRLALQRALLVFCLVAIPCFLAVTVSFELFLVTYSIWNSILSVTYMLSLGYSRFGIPRRQQAAIFLRPLLAAAAMVVAVMVFRWWVPGMDPLPRFAAGVALGAASFIIAAAVVAHGQIRTSVAFLSHGRGGHGETSA
jgi:O-antigen/teichoic acid export membrane protein